MKLSFRRYKKACKKKAQGRKLRPSDVYVIREGNYLKLLNRARALRNALIAITAANAAAQIAMLTSRPFPKGHPGAAIALKAIEAARTTMHFAEAIQKIQIEHPDPVRI